MPRDPTERWSALALLPAIATALYYVLSPSVQRHLLVQFAPQILAYGCMGWWASRNQCWLVRLGAAAGRVSHALGWGTAVGLLLGVVNVSIILWLVPWTGTDILFLRDTPHAQVPLPLMLPWVILLIAVFVEVNFRGFLLGRLQTWTVQALKLPAPFANALAVLTSALVFSFDPFMVATFRHLHWIALWDGVIWGMMRIRFGTVYATIVAHAVEVVVMYSVLKIVLDS